MWAPQKKMPGTWPLAWLKMLMDGSKGVPLRRDLCRFRCNRSKCF
jgi:hypothetical protein